MINIIYSISISILFFSCTSMNNTNGTIFKTSQNMVLIDSMYNARLEKWAKPYKITDVFTSYGRTNIIISGKEECPNLLLIPAMGVTATMWMANIQEFSKKYRVYSINTIGDIGKSEYLIASLSNYPKDGKQYAKWLLELCDSLNIKKTIVIGASMGGWIALNFASYYPEKTEKLILLAPMGLKPNYTLVMGKLLKVLLNPSDKNKKELIAFALGNNDAVVKDMYNYMYIATNCSPKISPPKGMKKNILKQIKARTLLILGTEDRCIGSTEKNGNFARKNIANLDIIKLNSGHLISIEQPDTISKLVINFINQK